jgi:hypothetical protein
MFEGHYNHHKVQILGSILTASQILLFSKEGDRIKKDEISGMCSKNGKKRNALKMLVRHLNVRDSLGDLKLMGEYYYHGNSSV